MSDYLKLVSDNQQKLEVRGFFKKAVDLANLLANNLISKIGHDSTHIAIGREKVFHEFCAVLDQAGIKPPVMEDGLWRAFLPRKNESAKYKLLLKDAQNFRDQVYEAIIGDTSQAAQSCRALAQFLVHFPDYGDSYGNLHSLKAMINELLVDHLNGFPIRPDYRNYKVNDILYVPENIDREITILVVDDQIEHLISSALTLCGMKNITIHFYLYDRENEFAELKGEARDKRLDEVANAIINQSPDMIIMDEGMGGIKGSDLISVIRAKRLDVPFIASTGGSAQAMYEVGCYKNFEKGQNPAGLLQALTHMHF